MRWRYVLTRSRDPGSGEESWEIRELYPDSDGQFSFTESAIAPHGSSPAELQRDLEHMLADLRLPYLDLFDEVPRLVELEPRHGDGEPD